MDSCPKGFQLVDADVGVGEVGGERMPKAVDQGATLAFSVDACSAKQSRHPVLHSVAGDPGVVLGVDEQRSIGGPAAQSGSSQMGV